VHPDLDPTTVQVDGSFNGWSSGVICTNSPSAANGANTNIYSTVISIGAGTPVQYQFRYLWTGQTQYDHDPSGNNRAYTVPDVTTTNLPTVFFGNTLPTDLLDQDTVVTFSVDMTNAVGTDAHVFNPSSDSVYINGDFLNWINWDPISLGTEVMTNNPPGSEVYSWAYTFPKGKSRQVNYKYSINGADNEAVVNANHLRYIRSTNGVYQMPLDTFGNQYHEPKIGGLTIGTPSGGQIPISWLPYPSALLQSRSDLKIGTWQDIPATQGGGSTNWPATGGKMFFRLKGL